MTISEQVQEAPKDNTANGSTTLSTADFLREYFRGTEGAVFVCSYRNPDSKLPKGELGKIVTRDPGAVSKFVVSRDKPEHENGIYFSTATYKPDVISRVSENCLQFVSLFADVDDKNHELSRDMVLALLENAVSPPTLIVSSGHGLQPYWLLSEQVDDRNRIEAARKKLHVLTASDAVHDAARIMRLVGTHNSKFGDWCKVEVVSYHPEYRYSLEALEDWLDRAPIIVPRKPEPETEQQHTNGHAHNGGGYQFHNDPVDIERVREAIKHIPAHDREVWYKIGMALKDELGDAGFSVWNEWSRSSKKYDERDQHNKWKSFRRDGIGIGTLFDYAKKYGWDSRSNKNGHARPNGHSKDEPPQLTEDALALRFSERHANDLRYIATKGTWLNWDGTRWYAEGTHLAFDLARQSCRADAQQFGNGKPPNSVYSAKTIAAVERMAKADRRQATTIEEWDANDLNFTTGQT